MANTYQLTQTGPQVQADLDAVEAGDIVYLTSAPTADNTSGKLKIVVLEEEPPTRYTGYIYIIKTGASSSYEVVVSANSSVTIYKGAYASKTDIQTISGGQSYTVTDLQAGDYLGVYTTSYPYAGVNASSNLTLVENGDGSGYATFSVQGNGTLDASPWCCFAAGTMITLADNTEKAIEEIKPGDKLLSYDKELGGFVIQPVEEVYTKYNTLDMVELKFTNGSTLCMAAYHPILTLDGYKSLRPETIEQELHYEQDIEKSRLNIGDKVITKDGVTQLEEVVALPDLERCTTYTLDIEPVDNFIANGIVVHNHN